MKKQKIFKQYFVFIWILTILITFLFTAACGDNAKPDPKLPSAKIVEEVTSQNGIPDGWKTYQFQDWIISLPQNWNGDEDAGVWWPDKGNLQMGRPVLSVHTGGIPLMPNTNFEERVKQHLNANPQQRQNVTVSGISGFKCTWAFMDKEHSAIFLNEKIGGGIGVIHFVDCQAPKNDFSKYKETFEKILSTFHRK